MSVFLKVDDVCKSFGRLVALSGVSFEVKRGEVLGLIGPNGAGKTTLFNVITGFYPSTSGSVVFKGRDVTREKTNKLVEMGMIRTFQIPKPFKELTVHDNVAMGTLFDQGRIGKLSKSKAKFVEEILKGVKLHHLKEEFAGVLGYGNQKLLEFGRAQGPAPELLLLDEPFAGLAAGEIEFASEILKDLAKKGLTLIIVEHKLRELMKLVERVIVLYYGKKIADSSPEEISRDEKVLKAYLGRRWSRQNA
jgi:branched-chain amino acid transport system ATP-binding protein